MIIMKWQIDACPLPPAPGSSRGRVWSSPRSLGGVKAEPTPLRLSVLAMAGAAIMLLGCQDSGDRGRNELGSSASSDRSVDRDDTGPGGGPSADPTSGSDDAEEGGSGGVGGPDGGGASGAESGGASGSGSGAGGGSGSSN
jgi:hypothetical protein